jgi:hypothetical protein
VQAAGWKSVCQPGVQLNYVAPLRCSCGRLDCLCHRTQSAGWLASCLATAVLVRALRSPAAALIASHVGSLHLTPMPALRQHPAIQRGNKSFKALKSESCLPQTQQLMTDQLTLRARSHKCLRAVLATGYWGKV